MRKLTAYIFSMPTLLARVLIVALIALTGFDTACAQPSPTASPTTAPPVDREMRAVWVASVSNIDWPSKPGLSTREQQDELIALLDRSAALRLNAVILQVRPGGDALYASPHEPWSEYLTGQMGKAPEPYYDPLEFAVNEAHRRGLELHAWFNPYRARHPSAKSTPTASHISRTHPSLVKTYGRHLWMDPGESAIREHSIRVVLDVVKRYDIDGVHIDDYFYPYKERDRRGNVIDFPDAPSWRRYVSSGGRLARDDWRRANVDSLVHQVYRAIKASKPWVKFGISPFGIWRPGYPPQITGLDSHAELYGDSRKWVNEGWGDYFTPQLYWPIDRENQSYPVLLEWWVEQNRKGRHMWPGNYSDKVGLGSTGWEAQEILDQIRATRAQRGATGNVFFSMRSFMNGTTGLPEKIASGPYATRALVPASPWLDSIPPSMPIVRSGRDAGSGALRLTLQPQGAEPTWLWVIRSRANGQWTTDIVPGFTRTYTFALSLGPSAVETVVVTAVDRTGNESAPVLIGVTPN
jgi:uncharacterized lipoprotein YddW (UPF0748 family)